MSPHELKVKFLGHLYFIDLNFQYHPFYDSQKVTGINFLKYFTEAIRIANDLYNALESLFLEGDKDYSILSKHIDELIQVIEINKDNCLKYLKDNKKQYEDYDKNSLNKVIMNFIKYLDDSKVNLLDVSEGDYKKLVVKYFEKEDEIKSRNGELLANDESTSWFRYGMSQAYYKHLSKFNEDLKFLSGQIEKKSHVVIESIANRKEKRTLSDIALQFVWEGKIINRQNKNIIANQLTSNSIIKLKNGNRLYNYFCFYNKKCNRIADQASDTKNRNHQERMERALKYLKEDKHKEAAESDILTFKTNAKNISGTIL